MLRHLAAAGRICSVGHRVLIRIGRRAFAQSGNAAAQDQGKPPAANAADATKDNQRKTDEFVEAPAGHQRPGRQPGMRLARPPRRPPDVAG